jgi:hypothetical protein
MWELSIAIRGGRIPRLREGENLMSDDFGKRVDAIRTAYNDKLKANQVFIAAWSRVSKEIIRPVLRIAQQNMSTRDLSLDIEDRNDDLVLTFTTIPVGKISKKLCYHPRAHEEVVVVLDDINGKLESKQKLTLDSISTDLIESQVEDFLKEALRLQV